MRIAWFCGGYPPDRNGGVPSIMKQLKEGLEAKGHEVTVITPRFAQGLEGKGFVQFGLPLPHLHENIHYGLWSWKALNFLRANAGRFDVYCGHMVWGFLACLVGKTLWPKQKWVVVPHVPAEVYPGWRKGFAHRANHWITKRAFGKADGIIAISDYLKADIEQNFPFTRGKVRRVYYGVETEAFRRGPETGAKAGKRPKKRLLYLARLRKEKGVEDAIQAYELLKQRGLARGVELAVAGGCSPAYLEYLQRTYPATKFLGQLTQEQAIEEYRKADLYIIPSVNESFCLTLVEAMACELPVVCSDLPIFREITQGRAFFAPAGNPEKLADKIAEALARTDLPEIGKRMRALAARYSVENNVSGYERVFEELAGAGK